MVDQHMNEGLQGWASPVRRRLLEHLTDPVQHPTQTGAGAKEAGFGWAREHARAVAVTVQGPARSAGAWLAQLGRLVDVLGDWGPARPRTMTPLTGGRP